ncbi:MAG: hypothetical protein ACO4AK_05505 [Candidatus Nanopelagicales bacterium]
MTTWGAVRLAIGVILTCLGTAALALSVPAALSAATIEASVGRTGVVTKQWGTLSAASGDRAVVVDGVTAALVAPQTPEWVNDALVLLSTDSQQVAEQVGDVVLVATMSTDAPGFLGVAPVDSVNEYLDGSAYSVAVLSTQNGEVTWPTVSVPGSVDPAAPEGEAFWLASATGTAPELAGAALEGNTLVLMRADAEGDPAAALRLEYRVAGADRALESAAVSAAGLSLGGLSLILLGGWMVVGRKRSA